jgi:hypothetical protein
MRKKNTWQVIVNSNRRTPPYDLRGTIEIRMAHGVRVNDVWVPWSCVEDIVPTN